MNYYVPVISSLRYMVGICKASPYRLCDFHWAATLKHGDFQPEVMLLAQHSDAAEMSLSPLELEDAPPNNTFGVLAPVTLMTLL